MTKKRKISYYSPECFLDVDIPVLDQLCLTNNILWIIIWDSIGFYSTKEIELFCKERKIKYLFIERKHRRVSLYQIQVSAKILNRITEFKPSVFYFVQFDNPFMAIMSFILLPVKKVIVAVHDIKPHSNHINFFGKIHKTFYLKNYRNFHLFSSIQELYLMDMYPKKKSHLIPMNLKDFGTGKKEARNNNNIRLLFFGKIHLYKGLDILIEAINLLDNSEQFEITIAGNSNDFDCYKKLIRKGNYNFQIGFVENKSIPVLFLNHDFLILPYKDVTQSGPLLIAFNYNLPVIASDLEGFSEHISDNENGYLFEVNNPVSLKEKLFYIAKNKNIEEIKRCQSQYVQRNFDKVMIGKKYNEMLDKIQFEK